MNALAGAPEYVRLDFALLDRTMSEPSPDSNASLPPNLIWVGSLFGISFYFIDAFIDALIFGEQSVLDQLLRPIPLEIWIRLVVLVLCTIFGIYAHYLLRRERSMTMRARTAEQFLTSVIDNIPDMVFIKDAEQLRFVRVNAAAEKLLGFSTRELTGKNDYDIFSAVQADFFTRIDREALTGHSAVEVEEEIDTKPFGKRMLHTKKVAILDQNGAPVYLLGISEDITRRKQAEMRAAAEKDRAERYLQISRAIIVGLDREGRVEVINRRGCEILGYEEQEILGRNWSETVIPPTNRAQFYEVFQAIMAGDLESIGYFEGEIVRKDGGIRYIAWNNSCLRDSTGRITGALSSGQDITDHKSAEQEAHRHQRELAHVIRLTTMGEMASGMAHELNQPLAAIVNYCEAAVHMLNRNRPAADIGIVLARAMEQAHRAADIIQHLREFVGKGTTTQEPIDVNEIIYDAVRLITWELRNAQVTLELRLTPTQPRVFADKVQIEQVLFNFVRNSIEAIQGTAIANGHIVVESMLSDGESVRVSVSDNGPGIDSSMLDRMFEPYQTTKEKGMGIGLSISRSIIEAHRGRLWFDRSAGGGACFGFDLPLCREGVDA